jgi:hypothetical protein
MIRVIAAGIVWPITFLAIGLGYLKFGPDVESALDPVLVDQSISDTIRSGSTVCWIWRWRKDHDAQPAGFAWSFTLAGTSVAYPAVAFRKEDGVVISEGRTRPPGPGSAHLCAEIPATLDKVAGLTIEGAAAYKSPVGPWLVWQDMPPVPVPPPPGVDLPCRRPRISLLARPTFTASSWTSAKATRRKPWRVRSA